MKFRCERDTLADAVGTAQRAVRRRGPARCRCCPALRVTLTDGRASSSAPTSSSRSGSGYRPRARARAARSCRRSCSSTSCAGSRAAPVSVESPTTSAHRRVRPVQSRRCARCRPTEFPRLPEARRGRRSRVDAAALAEALRQVVPAASKDDARPILTGVLLTASGRGAAARRHRLLPARGPRPAGRRACCRGPEGARRREGPRRGPAPARGSGEIEVCLAERDVTFRVGERMSPRGSSRASSRTTSS